MTKLHTGALIMPSKDFSKPKITMFLSKMKFHNSNMGQNVFYHFICAKIFSSGEIDLWRVILAFIGARSTVIYFCRRLDQVGAPLLSLKLHRLHLVFRQLLGFKK
jgi:hypothetical protein